VIPRVRTERLLLREWHDEDVERFAEMHADPEVMRFLGGVANRQAAWRHVAVMAGHWALRGYGNWVLERREDGLVLGRAGLWRPDGWPGLELAWMLSRDCWGAGYATEAARATREWAAEELGTLELISLIDPANDRSQAVARRLGMEPRGDWEINGAPVVVFGDSPRG
jgi:RimJ/RimL family protein N-acetyltransferase